MATIGARNAARLALVLVLSCCIVLISPRDAGADPGGLDYVQFNMWGRVGHAGGLAPANALTGFLEQRAQQGHIPSAVSLQEVCHSNNVSQATALVGGMPSYTIAFAPIVPLPDTNCQSYGIALAMVGARTGANGPSWQRYALPDQGENRELMCGHAWLFSWHNACTTHLDNTDAGANAQVASVIWNAAIFDNQHTPANSQYLGGDFNLEPDEFNPDTPYNFYLEADHCCNRPTWNTKASLIAKLDYALVRPNFVSDSTAVRWTFSQSDHMLLEGHFDWA